MEENHITKFETEFESDVVPLDFRISELKDYAKMFADYELAPAYPGGSHGNLSFRIVAEQDPFIITASMTALFDPLKSEDFVQVNFVDIDTNKVYAEGKRLPSSESIIHFGVYRVREDVNVIFHGHSEYILKNVDKLGIPQTAEEKEFGTIDLVEQVLDVASEHDFFVMKNHGFIALGKNMEEAWSKVEKYIDTPKFSL